MHVLCTFSYSRAAQPYNFVVCVLDSILMVYVTVKKDCKLSICFIKRGWLILTVTNNALHKTHCVLLK